MHDDHLRTSLDADPYDDPQPSGEHLIVEPLRTPGQPGRVATLVEHAGKALAARPALVRVLALLAIASLLLVVAAPLVQPRLAALLPSATPPPDRGPRSGTISTSGSISIQLVTPTPAPGEGWIPAPSLTKAQQLVFAPHASSIGYACESPELSSFDQPVPLLVRASQDHGATWRPFETGAFGVACALSVNPGNFSDVVLAAIPPPGVSAAQVGKRGFSLAFYRSHDGGATWHAMPLPPSTSGALSFSYFSWAWSGATLYIAPNTAGEDGAARLAASAFGGPFRWIARTGLVANLPPEVRSTARIIGLIGTPASLYINLTSPVEPKSHACGDVCVWTVQSVDGGASYALYQPTYENLPVMVLGASFDTFLYGFIRTADQRGQFCCAYAQSLDGGTTWVPLPRTLPPDMPLLQLLQTPSGAYYAELDASSIPFSPPPGVYAWVSGDQSWRFVAPVPGNGGFIAITWDERGFPLQLWGSAATPGPGHVQAGIQSHTP